MSRQVLVIFVLMAVIAGVVMAIPARVERVPQPVVLTGLEDCVPGPVMPERPITPQLDDYTPGSIVDTAGWTWYDIQTNGTHGKQIGTDADGYVHFVWTSGVNQGSGQRHIYYNVWDPTAQDFMHGTGVQVDAASRAGFCNLAVDPAGWAYPFFHQTTSGTHTAAAIDFLPRSGAFFTSQVPLFQNLEIIWPHVSIDIHGDLHSVSHKNPTPTGSYYAKGHPTFDPSPPDSFGLNIEWGGGFQQWGLQTFITTDIAASPVSNKIAVAYLYDEDSDQVGDNVWIRISENAGATWGAPINITNFQVIDTNCVNQGGDIAECNGDTLRPWIDLSILIDANDVVHVAFSTWAWYYWWTDGSVGPWILTARPSLIWHWDELNQEYNLLADGWYAPNDENFSWGVNQLNCHRPSLAQDTTTGWLYCSFQRYDSVQINTCGHPLADAWVTVSTDGGRFWSEPTNVTGTVGPAGNNDRSERDINIAPWVTDGFIHMQYMVDHSAGSYNSTTPECNEARNEMVYQRIPVADILPDPLLPAYPLRADSTGYPQPLSTNDPRVSLPVEFTLHQNYPNPFNPTTNIQFDLVRSANVSLKVFDITGREVAVLVNGEAMSSGVHMVEFDANSLPSGVYFYRLDALGTQSTRKMVLLK